MKNTKVEEEEEKRDENEANPSQSMLPKLPEVIISDILSRLPVKTICRFRCMCKSWYKLLLSDPYFAQLHLSRSHTTTITTTTLITKGRKSLYMGELDESTDKLNTLGSLKINPELSHFLAFNMKPIASCNGLILLTSFRSVLNNTFVQYGNYVVCNPLMGQQYMNLPKLTRDGSFGLFGGFGFSPSTRQYKIMQLWPVDYNHEVEILTLGTNMWRSIGGYLPKKHKRIGFPTYFKGALHWLDYTLDNVVHISRFDLGSERFELFPAPPSSGKYWSYISYYMSFGVLGEHLYVIGNHSGSDLDVWIMKDYGVKESWTKECVITYNCKCNSGWRVDILSCGAKSSILLMRCCPRHLFAYNLRSKCGREVRGTGVSLTYDIKDVVPHVASFVSLMDAVLDGENFKIDEFGCLEAIPRQCTN